VELLSGNSPRNFFVMTTKHIDQREFLAGNFEAFLAGNFEAVFLRFHSETVLTDEKTKEKTYSGCSRIEFVGIELPSADSVSCCQAGPEEAVEILEHFPQALVCWSTAEIYTLQRYFGGDIKITDQETILETKSFQIRSAEWTLIQRISLKGKTFQCLDLTRLVSCIVGESFIVGYEVTPEQSLQKTCQIAKVICARWINWFGIQIPGFFFFETEKPVKKTRFARPVLKK
jgi:hypothetical protein